MIANENFFVIIFSWCITKLFNAWFQTVSIVQEMQRFLEDAAGDGAKAASCKMNAVLQKNSGYGQLVKIADILQEKASMDAVFGKDEGYSPSDISCYAYAPMASCDVERSFSRYKTILSDRRQNFTFDNLRQYFVVHCNARDAASHV